MSHLKHSTAFCLLVFAWLPPQIRAQTPPPAPAEYQDLYNEMYSDLTQFQSAMRRFAPRLTIRLQAQFIEHAEPDRDDLHSRVYGEQRAGPDHLLLCCGRTDGA